MLSSSRDAALRHYRSSGTAAAVCDVSQHRLIAMLYDGALERVGRAAHAMTNRDINVKLRSVHSALEILAYLRQILDLRAGGQTAQNLAKFYDYMMHRLTRANATNDVEGLIEVAKLLSKIKLEWDQIPESART